MFVSILGGVIVFGLFGLIAGVPRIQEIPGWQRFTRGRGSEKSQGRGRGLLTVKKADILVLFILIF